MRLRALSLRPVHGRWRGSSLGGSLEGAGDRLSAPPLEPSDSPLANGDPRTREILARETTLASPPDMMLVVLTGRCNIECIMCPYRNSLLQDVPDRVLEQIPTFYPHLRVIEWEGGEAFVHRMFFDLVRQAARFPALRQVITTSGLLLNADWIDLIVNSNISMAISVDGATPETYEYIRKGGRWEPLIRNLNSLNEALDRVGKPPRFQLNVVLMRSNIHELDAFMDFAKSHRFSRVNFKMMKTFEHIPEAHEENLYAPQNAALLEGLIRDVPRIDRRGEAVGIGINWPGLTTPEEIAKQEPALASAVRENGMFVEAHKFGEEVERCASPAPVSGVSPEKMHCVLPWRRLYLNSGGVSVACGCIPESRYTPDFDLLAFWNSAMMQTFRGKIAAGATDWCGMNCLLGRENRMSQETWEEWQGRVPVCGELV